MKESEFYEGLLSLSEIKIDRVKMRDKKIEIYCHTKSETQTCKTCSESVSSVNQYTTRTVRDLDIVGKEVWLIITVRQMYCPVCNQYFTEPLGFVDSGKSYTQRQSKWVFELCTQQPFSEVGALINMPPKTVENMYFFLHLDSFFFFFILKKNKLKIEQFILFFCIFFRISNLFFLQI